MKFEWIEKIRSKKSKNNKNHSEIAAYKKRTTSEKANFCSNTVFSLYLKNRVKISRRKTTRFSLHFLFRRDQNHYSNLTPKFMKMCEQIFKKKTAPQYNSISLNCKTKSTAYSISFRRSFQVFRSNNVNVKKLDTLGLQRANNNFVQNHNNNVKDQN